MKYTDVVYAHSRLERTFILHKNRLQLVIGFNDLNNKLRLQKKSGQISEVTIDALDLTPVKLGYVNFKDSCIYTCRIPMRRDWKQGLRPNNLNITSFPPYEDQFLIENTNSMFVLEPTCLGKYPSYRQCVDDIEETHRARAFSRYFCVDEEGNVSYKSRTHIGKIEDERSIKLLPTYIHLKELLEESLVNPNNHDELTMVRT